MNPLNSPLYRRLLIGFVAANLAALLLGIFIVDRVVRRAELSEPDWTELAQAADQAYEMNGAAGFAVWAAERRQEGIDAMLFENERPLSERSLPMPLRDLLPRLLSNDDIMLRPRPEVRIVGKAVTGADGVRRQLVAVRGPRPPHVRRQTFLIVQIVLSLLGIGVVGWWIARGVAKPVEALRGATQRMAAGELSARVGPQWTNAQDELGQLARDFDGMAGRIESLVAHERSVLQDLSHELRSPLARLQLILDLAQSGKPEEAATHFRRGEAEIERLDRMIGEILALSRMEADLPGMERERVTLAGLARGRVDAAGLEAQPRELQLSMATNATPAVLGNAALLERALDNLLANAIKFSAPGGAIAVSLDQSAGRAILCVRDHGPGVPPDEIASLFRPFFRGSNAERAQGHGLGLAIVARIVQAHGGNVQALNAEGGGLIVKISLPLALEHAERRPGSRSG
ncbi:MAG: histidine kinase [Nevskia sp.]|nr:histidine kinase [Nevskia sp.]